MEVSDLTYLLFAFAGGIIGACFGGLNAFVLCGVSAVIGTVYGKCDHWRVAHVILPCGALFGCWRRQEGRKVWDDKVGLMHG